MMNISPKLREASALDVFKREVPDHDAPMTEKQAVRLRELAERLGEDFDGNLTKLQAAKRIAALEEMAEEQE